MSGAAEAGKAGAAGFLRGSAPLVLIVASVFLGWQILKEVAIQRLPPELAVQVSADASSTLTRAAEFEFAAGRYDNAGYLARLSLAKAPFNVRALRVVGLVEAEEGRTALADNLITLAGNWSLRDDPAHAWLFEHRLRSGQYGSAFAHADTLARRREDMWPSLFELFAVAATEDPRALPVVVSLLAEKPPWRHGFLNRLMYAQTPRNLQLLATLAVNLQLTDGPLSQGELVQVYESLLRARQDELLALVREKTNRPAAGLLLVNGGFDPPSNPAPFEWSMSYSVGIAPEIMPDARRPSDSALRVEYDGYSTGVVASQLLQLDPGRYRLTGQVRAEAGAVAERLRWTASCYLTNQTLGETAPNSPVSGDGWRPFTLAFEVPPQGCRIQRLTLSGFPTDRRATIVAWYDRFSIARVS